MMIKPVNTANGRGWQVRMGKQSVTLRSETEARQFAGTLEARLHGSSRVAHRATAHRQLA